MRIALALFSLAAPLTVHAQDHSGHAMPVEEPAPEEHSAHDAMNHATMDHSRMNQEQMGHGSMNQGSTDHAAMDHSAHGPESTKESVPLDETPPPAALSGPRHAADAVWGADAMAPAREAVRRANGAMTTGTFMLERFEARIGEHEAYLWDAEAWFGGDEDKLWLKSEGEGEFGSALEDAEVQALWSHAIAPFWDLQTGLRYDFEPDSRAHAVIGVQGLAPYMFHVDAAAFLSDRGDLTARIEAEYDQRLTQRLILQPRIELELSAQDIPERALGAGLTRIEPGLRLRYEFVREFAPYIGVEYEASIGETADIVRAGGEDPDGVLFLAGIRAWF